MKTINELKEMEVINSPEMLETERETYISFDDELVKKGYLKITSFQKTVIKSLLNNDNFIIKKYYLDQKTNSKIVYISGVLPLSCLRVKSKSNDSMNYLSRVFE